ncbi:MAG: MMPL family transporter [Planctomycetes bacterium]|nr:MMPL family transporter [Planctomycetota bacterium]
MPWICRIALARPKSVVAIALLIVLALSPGLPRLGLRTDGHALLPQNEPGIRVDNRIRDAFNLRDQIVILIRTQHENGIFNEHTLSLIRDLSDRLLALPDVDAANVTSLSTEKNDRVLPGTLTFRPFLDSIPQSEVELNRLRDDLRSFGIYHGTLISRDEKASCILMGVKDGADRQAVYLAIRKLAAESQPEPDRVDVVGAPVAESLLGTHILEDLGVPSVLLGMEGASEGEPPARVDSIYGLRRWIAGTIGLVPIAVALMALVFLVMFRRIAAAALPLMEVGACLVFTFALMGWFGVPVYLTIAVMPIILCAAGVTDEIHIFNRYRQIARDMPQASGAEIAAAAMTDMWRPVLKTSATTAIGFLAFATSDLKPVQAFGIFCAIGILFCMVWSLTVVPAMLALLPRRTLVRDLNLPDSNERRGLETGLARVADWFIRRRSIVLLSTAAILILTPFGISHLRVQDSWIDGFSPESAFRHATESVNEGFFGTHLLIMELSMPHEEHRGQIEPGDISMFEIRLPAKDAADASKWVGWFIDIAPLKQDAAHAESDLNPPMNAPLQALNERLTRLAEIASVETQGDHVVIKTRREYGPLNFRVSGTLPKKLQYLISPKPMYRPEILHAICKLDDFVRAKTENAVGGVLGPCEYLSTLNYSALARKEEQRKIPDDAHRIHWLWDQYERLRGKERVRQILDTTSSRCLVSIFLSDANYIRTGRLMQEIRAYEARELAPRGMSIAFAGDIAASQTLIQSIVRTQISSVIGSLIGIFLMIAILNRSIGWGLLAVLPCSLAVAVNFAVMGWLDIPIGVATSMFASMTLGIGVDHAVHLIERFREERSHGANPHDATVRSFALNGLAILTDALAICLGFGVMILSQVPSNARLGLLVIVCDMACVIGTLLILPAIMARRRA